VNPTAALEAILFVAEHPVPESELAQVLETPLTTVRQHLAEWALELEADHRGIVLRHVAGGWRLYTKREALPYLERFATTDDGSRLSPAALEVLAVVAYRQPVTRGQVSELRGVDSASALRTLLRRGLVAEEGRLSTPGHPAVYGTTGRFLEALGMASLADLPPLTDHMPAPEMAEALDRPPTRSGEPQTTEG
jgi:segregation and condensation protein B